MEADAAEEARRQELEDQEQRDRELALRLAAEDQTQVEDISQAVAKYVHNLIKEGSYNMNDI